MHKAGSTFKNQLTHQQAKKVNHIISSIYAEKTFDKIQCLFMIKTLSLLRIERSFLNLINNVYI